MKQLWEGKGSSKNVGVGRPPPCYNRCGITKDVLSSLRAGFSAVAGTQWGVCLASYRHYSWARGGRGGIFQVLKFQEVQSPGFEEDVVDVVVAPRNARGRENRARPLHM